MNKIGNFRVLPVLPGLVGPDRLEGFAVVQLARLIKPTRQEKKLKQLKKERNS